MLMNVVYDVYIEHSKSYARGGATPTFRGKVVDIYDIDAMNNWKYNKTKNSAEQNRVHTLWVHDTYRMESVICRYSNKFSLLA